MQRYLEQRIGADLARKMVILTGPRQVGKTTLCRQLMDRLGPAQYLNWDVAADRAIIARQSWSPHNRLLVLDEIHKMPGWKRWLKGVVDARSAGQAWLAQLAA
jgi:predicted AAA+ superfamily ATPase